MWNASLIYCSLLQTFDIRNPEEFDEEWLLQQLGKV